MEQITTSESVIDVFFFIEFSCSFVKISVQSLNTALNKLTFWVSSDNQYFLTCRSYKNYIKHVIGIYSNSKSLPINVRSYKKITTMLYFVQRNFLGLCSQTKCKPVSITIELGLNHYSNYSLINWNLHVKIAN